MERNGYAGRIMFQEAVSCLEDAAAEDTSGHQREYGELAVPRRHLVPVGDALERRREWWLSSHSSVEPRLHQCLSMFQ